MAFLESLVSAFTGSEGWQDWQIAKLRAAVEGLQEAHGVASSDEASVARLQWENAELRLYLAALLRILIEKGMVTTKELSATVAALTAVGSVSLQPPKEVDWTATPPPVRGTE